MSKKGKIFCWLVSHPVDTSEPARQFQGCHLKFLLKRKKINLLKTYLNKIIQSFCPRIYGKWFTHPPSYPVIFSSEELDSQKELFHFELVKLMVILEKQRYKILKPILSFKITFPPDLAPNNKKYSIEFYELVSPMCLY